MKVAIAIAIAIILTGCIEEDEPPECTLPPYSGQTLQSERIIDTGSTYEHWCGDKYLREIEATEQAMTLRCGDDGEMVGERWECDAYWHTTYETAEVVCECPRLAGSPLTGPRL